MCRIAGYIGESSNPHKTYELITRLFEESEVKGKDASGFWGTQKGDGKILYHKEPFRSTEFVKRKIWKDTSKLDPNLLLVHARGASKGVGLPAINKNNHPFVSDDCSVGMIHNGRISQSEYSLLKKKYEVNTDCDSEIILRLYESAGGSINGIKNILIHTLDSKFAIAVGERAKEDRSLCLFRNRYRPLWVVDLREQLNQIFFCSTPEIWRSASDGKFPNTKLTQIPINQIWNLTLEAAEIKIAKYKIAIKGIDSWTPNGEYSMISESDGYAADVYGELDENDEVIRSRLDTEEFYEEVLDCKSVSTACRELENVVSKVEEAVFSNYFEPWAFGNVNHVLSHCKMMLERELKHSLKQGG